MSKYVGEAEYDGGIYTFVVDAKTVMEARSKGVDNILRQTGGTRGGGGITFHFTRLARSADDPTVTWYQMSPEENADRRKSESKAIKKILAAEERRLAQVRKEREKAKREREQRLEAGRYEAAHGRGGPQVPAGRPYKGGAGVKRTPPKK